MAVAAPAAAEEKEGVFEIRDFTTASDFERFTHRIALAVKKWGKALANGEHPDLQVEASPGFVKRTMREEFEHADRKLELIFHLAESDATAGEAANKVVVMEKLGVHSFPTRTPRLNRLFGVQHYVVIGMPDSNIELDSARTILSALSLASQGSSFPSTSQPMSCFVHIGGGRRFQHLGELCVHGLRVAYSTDLSLTVESRLEHLAGLLDFFWRKVSIDPQHVQHALTIGTRFTYIAEEFQPLRSKLVRMPALAADEASPGNPASPSRSPPGRSPAQADSSVLDPVEILHLYCMWPSFPAGSFTDNAVYSELDPRIAPHWTLRAMLLESPRLVRSQELRTLLDFEKEARGVKSAEHSSLPQMPKTALASLSFAIQESLESIMLPPAGEMLQLTESCMNSPISVTSNSSAKLSIPGAALGCRLARIAELGANMKCFKGVVVLWCQVVAQMRKQWDDLDLRPAGCASPATQRLSMGSSRVESLDLTNCLIQQKFEMLQCSIEAQLRRTRSEQVDTDAAEPTPLTLSGTTAPLLAPSLQPPHLLTKDMLTQRELLRRQMVNPVELAELHGREIRSDIAAFKDANPDARLADFLAWRSEVEGLTHTDFPQEWLLECWTSTAGVPASSQTRQLFEPEKEAEMSLNFLENIDGTQLLLQLLCVHISVSLAELQALVQSLFGQSPHHDELYAKVCLAAEEAFTRAAAPSGGEQAVLDADAQGMNEELQEATFPSQDQLQNLLEAFEEFELAVHAAESLAAKLPGVGMAFIADVVKHGEAAVIDAEHRKTVEDLFSQGYALKLAQSRQPPDGRGIFDDLPFAKEFIFLLQQVDGVGGPHRMYTEIRENHQRLACAQSFSTD